MRRNLVIFTILFAGLIKTDAAEASNCISRTFTPCVIDSTLDGETSSEKQSKELVLTAGIPDDLNTSHKISCEVEILERTNETIWIAIGKANSSFINGKTYLSLSEDVLSICMKRTIQLNLTCDNAQRYCINAKFHNVTEILHRQKKHSVESSRLLTEKQDSESSYFWSVGLSFFVGVAGTVIFTLCVRSTAKKDRSSDSSLRSHNTIVKSQITRSTQTSPSLHKTTDCEISEEHSSIDSIDQLHANSKHWTTSEPQTNSEQSVPQTHSETSAIPVTQIHSECSTIPVTQTNSESSTIPVPQTYSEPSKMPEPQTNSESSTIPVPQTYSEPSRIPEPQTNSESSTIPVPQTNSASSTIPVPQTNSESSTIPVPQTNSESSTIPVPQAYSEPSKMPEPQTNSKSSTIPVPQTNSESSVPQTNSEHSTIPVPQTNSESSMPQTNSESSTIPVPQANSESSVPQTNSEHLTIPVPQTNSESSLPQTNSEHLTIPVPQTNSDGTVESNDVIIQPGCNDSKYIGNSILGYYV